MKNDMKNTAIMAAITMMFMSCDTGVMPVGSGKEIIMIGNKPYKAIDIRIQGESVITLVPADSSVSIIPTNTTYEDGKTTRHVIKIN